MITNPLPKTVFVEGLGHVPINTSFRAGIQVSLIHDIDQDARTRATGMFLHYFGNPYSEDLDGINHFQDMVKAAESFARLDDLAVIVKSSKRKSKDSRRTFDWDFDQKRLVADFQREYGIDLTSRDTQLHWWRFLALFEGLSQKSLTMTAIAYRALTVEASLPQKEKERLHKLQREYALPPKNSAEVIAADAELWGDSFE